MKRYKTVCMLVAACCLLGHSAACWASAYHVDKQHTQVSFNIRNFISTAVGSFHDFQGTVDYDPARPDTWTSTGTIKVKSIDTKNPERDRHLLSKDFFNADKFPEISFRIAKAFKGIKSAARIEGMLTIHGVERPVTLDVQNITLSLDKDRAEHLKFTAKVRIDRRDFGLTYGGSGPAKIALGDDVTITLQVDAVHA